MRALALTRWGCVEVVDAPEPEPAPGEVVVEVAGAGVCGSDVHGVHGGFLRQPPVIMGHEFSGTTADGRRVAVNPLVSCATCGSCVSGRDHLCAQRSFVGIHRDGGFSERVAVPGRNLVDLPGGVAVETGAMVEPLAVALHAWRLAPEGAGRRVAILGAGTIGLGVLLVCRDDAGEVVVADPDADRRHHAARLGAAATVARLDGSYDVVVDAAGSRDAHVASLEHLRPGGTAVWVGNASAEAGFDAREFVRSEQRVLGSTAYTREDFADAAARVAEVPADWATDFPLEAGVAVFDDLGAGRVRPLKARLRP